MGYWKSYYFLDLKKKKRISSAILIIWHFSLPVLSSRNVDVMPKVGAIILRLRAQNQYAKKGREERGEDLDSLWHHGAAIPRLGCLPLDVLL